MGGCSRLSATLSSVDYECRDKGKDEKGEPSNYLTAESAASNECPNRNVENCGEERLRDCAGNALGNSVHHSNIPLSAWGNNSG